MKLSETLKYYKPVKSNKPGKKFMVRVFIPKTGRDKIVHYGNSQYEDFTQHKDPKRKRNYLIRSSFIKKGGSLSKNDYTSPNFWARRKLWDSKEKYGKLPRPRI